MSAIDTYMKYNLHSAAPYIGENVRVCKKVGGTSERGKRPEGNVRRGGVGEMFYTSIWEQDCTACNKIVMRLDGVPKFQVS